MRAIVCYAGDNDLGDGKSPGEVVASFRKLLVKVDACFPSIPFTMLAIKPSPARWQLAEQIRATKFRAALQEKGIQPSFHIWSGEAHQARFWREMDATIF